jgi:DNA polymerase III subunit gamma/tau
MAAMSYKALYRTYRPHSFDTVVGQRHIVKTLQNALKQHKVSHAYLFCGPRGTGKTTVAKLVAKSVNCLNPAEAPCNRCEHCLSIQQGIHPDVIEIDAASNNGVDQIRDLIEKVKYAPLQAKYKVYIIDEVHMLSQGAFNALLKTLEEPPSHVIFILATTEPHKVLPTIISRCQRYDFTRVSQKDIQARIEEVLRKEGIQFDEEATRLIAQLSDGGVRDALSILEQVIAYSEDHLSAQHVNDIYGIATTQDKLLLLTAIQQQDVKQLMAEIEEITQKNIDIRRLTNDLMELLKESVIYAYTADPALLQKLSVDEAKTLNTIPSPVAIKMIDDLMETAEKYRSASDVLSYFEIGLLKLIGRLAPSSLTPVVETGLVSQPVLSEIQKLPVKRQPVRKTEETSILPIDQPTASVENEPIESEPVSAVVVEGDQAILNLGEPEPSDRGRLETTELSSEFLIQLLVNAEKQLRISDAEAWKNTSALALESNFMKSLTLIAESVIQASGEQFVLLSFDNPLRVHAINDVKNITEFAELSERLLKRKVRLFAISNADFEVVKSEFMRQLKGGILPNKAEMDLFPHKKARKKQTDPLIDKVGNLFGEENMVVVGGEES